MLSFIIATSLVCLIPGPSIILVIINTLKQGLLSGVKTILGVIIADAILMVLTLMGVGSVLYSSALAFSTLKWLGAAYLIYLGLTQFSSKNQDQVNYDQPSSSENPLLQGIGITLLNPKIIGFFIAFFPQFIDQSLSLKEQMYVLGPIFLGLVFIFMFLYAVIASSIRDFLGSSSGNKIVKRVSGVSLISCGILSASMSRS